MNQRSPRAARVLGALFAMWVPLAALADGPTTQPITKVACVGDSITAGATIKDPAHDGYPAQLQKMLGDGYKVDNFGNSGSTLLVHGDKPYVKQKQYTAALAMKADVVVIALGTNDSKPQNWSHKSEFPGDYASLIGAFRKSNPAVKVYICELPPAFPGFWAISEKVMTTEVTPAIVTIAADNDAKLIDLHGPLADDKVDFKDTVHPNAHGAGIIAKAVYEAVKPVDGK